MVSYGAGYTWTKQEDEGDWENTGETQYILHDPYGKTVLMYSIGNIRNTCRSLSCYRKWRERSYDCVS